MADGSVVDMSDLYFRVSAVDAAAAGVELPNIDDLLSNEINLDSLLDNVAAPVAAVAEQGQSTDSSMATESAALDVMKQMADLYDQAAA